MLDRLITLSAESTLATVHTRKKNLLPESTAVALALIGSL